MAALTPAVACGAAAAVIVPYVADGHDDWVGGLLTVEALRVPIGGVVLVWSWSVFCVVTLLCWALFAAARQK